MTEEELRQWYAEHFGEVLAPWQIRVAASLDEEMRSRRTEAIIADGPYRETGPTYAAIIDWYETHRHRLVPRSQFLMSREPYPPSSDYSRVKALADEETAAWEEILRGAGRRTDD